MSAKYDPKMVEKWAGMFIEEFRKEFFKVSDKNICVSVTYMPDTYRTWTVTVKSVGVKTYVEDIEFTNFSKEYKRVVKAMVPRYLESRKRKKAE